jgi:DNA-binding ferritin-like protein
MCRTLRLLLGHQQDDLGRAETELAKRAREIGGTPHGTKLPFGSVTSDGTAHAVDDRIVSLAQGHETAARSIRSVRELAEQARDLRTCKLLARRADVHDKAAWALTSMYLGSLISCELCAARFTCPLSAARPAAVVTVVEKCVHAHRHG